ncbi:hypothetical protein [Nocardioides sp.]|uniref:hypothetical protein n=1 Tax=Nocardioides sp. TaxID=35761 RepID=UPI0019A5B528|nr:hypothetical protein [Nocardioides sp.]MBC7278311.1 hypothetical protein [Nocardioides sp.]
MPALTRTRVAGVVLTAVVAGAAATWTTLRVRREVNAPEVPAPAERHHAEQPSVSAATGHQLRPPISDVLRILLGCAVSAAGIRFLYEMWWSPGPLGFTSSHSLLDIARASWTPSSPVNTSTIMTLVGIQLGTASALFIATAFAATTNAEPPLMEVRRVATQRLALAVAVTGGTAFLLLIPDAVASKAPVAMVCLCLFTVGVNVAMAAINGPRATDHERWATDAATTLTLITADIQGIEPGSTDKPSAGLAGRQPQGSVGLSTTRSPSDLQLLMRMIRGIRWPAIMLTFVLLGVISAALGYGVNVVAGVVFMAVNTLAHLLTVMTTVITLSTPRRPRIDQRSATRFLLQATDVAVCLSIPVVLVLTVFFVVAAEATTNLEVIYALAGSALELTLIVMVFLVITRNPSWKLGGLQRLERQVRQQEQWNREHAALWNRQA